MKSKQLVPQALVLQCYDVTKRVVIQRDSSGKGHGAVLLQDSKNVCYASLALTDAETRPPIEAEMVAAVFAVASSTSTYITEVLLLKQTTSPCRQ